MKQGILGGLSGKVGNVIGSAWKGIDVLRSMPVSVANPRTPSQQTQRNTFAQAVDFVKEILVPVVKPLWDRFAQQQSGYNAWISANISEFDATGLANPDNMVIAEGNLPGEAINNISIAAATPEVGVEWLNTQGNADDEAYIVVLNETTGDIATKDAPAIRGNNEALTGDFPNGLNTNDVLHAWLAFRRADGRSVSNTSYDTATVQ